MVQVENHVKRCVEQEGGQLVSFWCNTLHHPQDLPFQLQDLPQNFDKFRQRTQGVGPRAALEAPQQLKGPPLGGRVEVGEVPTLEQLGLTPLPKQRGTQQQGTSSRRQGLAAEAGDSSPRGGETEALRQLKCFLAHARPGGAEGGRRDSSTSSACYGSFSSNIAPWLAAGCLSPRRMLMDAQRALGGGLPSAQHSRAQQGGGSTAGEGDALTWINFELLWRDFFRFIALKYASLSEGSLGVRATKMPAGAAAASQVYTPNFAAA